VGIIAKSQQNGKKQNNLLLLMGFKQVGEFLKADDDDNDRG
jgi:hypothetical protein